MMVQGITEYEESLGAEPVASQDADLDHFYMSHISIQMFLHQDSLPLSRKEAHLIKNTVEE